MASICRVSALFAICVYVQLVTGFYSGCSSSIIISSSSSAGGSSSSSAASCCFRSLSRPPFDHYAGSNNNQCWSTQQFGGAGSDGIGGDGGGGGGRGGGRGGGNGGGDGDDGQGDDGDSRGPYFLYGAAAVASVGTRADGVPDEVDAEDNPLVRNGASRKSEAATLRSKDPPFAFFPRFPWQRNQQQEQPAEERQGDDDTNDNGRNDPAGELTEEQRLQKAKEEEANQLPRMLVKDISIHNTKIMPKEVLSTAVVASGLLGKHVSQDKITSCVRYLNGWYKSQGYMLAQVTKIDLIPRQNAVVFEVEEPMVSQTQPINIVFLQKINATNPNSDYKIAAKGGKTKPGTVARALNLKGGEPFKWDNARWLAVQNSGLFSIAHLTRATVNKDGEASLEMQVVEKKSMVFEPGITKTLFDGKWSGEVVFEDRNLLGRNSVLGVNMKRTMKCPFTSYSVRLGNNRFNKPGAWNAVAFRDVVSNGAASDGGSYGMSSLGGGSGGGSGHGGFGSGDNTGGGGAKGGLRDIRMLTRALKGSRSTGTKASQNSTAEAAAEEPVIDLARRQGFTVMTAWPYRLVSGNIGAQVQQITPLPGAKSNSGGFKTRQVKESDIITFMGDARKTFVLQRNDPSDELAARRRRRTVDDTPTMTALVDVRNGYHVEGFNVYNPFVQFGSTLVQRFPLPIDLSPLLRGGGGGGVGGLGEGPITLHLRQKLAMSSSATPSHQLLAVGGQHSVRGLEEGALGRVEHALLTTAEARIPFKNPLMDIPTEAVFFVDWAGFKPRKRAREASSAGGGAGAPSSGDGLGGGGGGDVIGIAGAEGAGGGMLTPPELSTGGSPSAVLRAHKEGLPSFINGLKSWNKKGSSGHNLFGGLRGGNSSGGGGGGSSGGMDDNKTDGSGVNGNVGLITSNPTLAALPPSALADQIPPPPRVESADLMSDLDSAMGYGVGLRIGGMLKIDVGRSKGGVDQVHIGVVDPLF